MTVTSIRDAWAEANKIFPTDYGHDTSRSERAGYVARDYCAGYRLEFLEDENPSTNLINGHLTTHTYMAPYIPAEYIENIREYDVDALTAALTT